jgi:hypothetical protein
MGRALEKWHLVVTFAHCQVESDPNVIDFLGGALNIFETMGRWRRTPDLGKNTVKRVL